MEDVSTLHTAVVVLEEGKARTARANTTSVLLTAAAKTKGPGRSLASLQESSDRHTDSHPPQGHTQERQDPKWDLEKAQRQTPEGYKGFICSVLCIKFFPHLGQELSFHENQQSDKPFFIIVLAKKDVVPESGIENPGLLGHVRERPTYCNAPLQQGHLEPQSSCEIMLPHVQNRLRSTEYK